MPDALQVRTHGARTIEDCRGDFENISRLIESSWAENKQQSILYEADFLASCFGYPGAKLSLAPTIYQDAEPLAFVAAFPRSVLIAEKRLNLGIITFLTAAKDQKKRGYGIVLWNEVVKRLREAGFDGMVNYCVDGESMNTMILGCCQMLKLPTVRALSIPYWSRMLQPRKSEGTAPTPSLVRAERFLELAAPIAQQTPLTRLWNLEEAEWQCHCRSGSVVTEFQSGSRRGMLVGYIMPVANANRTKCLIVDDVLWGDLEGTERRTLVKAFLAQASEAGAELAVLPVMGYADIEPFHAARFRPSHRTLHAYVTVWRGEPLLEALPSIYLDVF